MATTPIKYRISSVATKPTTDSVKGAPLTSLEIDGNFRSLKDSVEALSASGGAALVGNVPAGGVAATTVQAAINELDSEKISFTRLDDADGASLVGFTPTGTVAATNVQSAINEVVSDLAAGTGASLVGYNPAGTGAVATTVQSKLRETVSVLDFGAVGDWNGATGTDNTAAFQSAIDYVATFPNGGVVNTPSGAYYSDTIFMRSNVTLDLGGSEIFLKPHSTTHNPVIRIGDSGGALGQKSKGIGAVTNAVVRNGKLNGNRSGQTGAGDEFSPGIKIWGSSFNRVENVEISNVKGDGIWIGFDLERVAGSNNNTVSNCELYDVATGRAGVAITYGCNNSVSNNAISGSVNLEIDLGTGEIKNNKIFGNTGRIVGSDINGPCISDLFIQVASLNTNSARYQGNIITNNHCYYIRGEYATKTTIANNIIVGSNASNTYLLSIDAFDDCVISGNQFIANTAIATGLVGIMRTRACYALEVASNIVQNESLTFVASVPTYGAKYWGAHNFHDNIVLGVGSYRGSGADVETASEYARFRLDINAGTKTLTQVAGVPCTKKTIQTLENSVVLSDFGGTGTNAIFVFDSVGSVSQYASVNLTAPIFATIVYSAGSATVNFYTQNLTGAVTASQFLASSGTGTFYFDVYY